MTVLDRHHRAFAALVEGPTPSVEQVDALIARLIREYAPDDLISAIRRYRAGMVEVWRLRAQAALGVAVSRGAN